jgi:serine/threonine-protein kinase
MVVVGSEVGIVISLGPAPEQVEKVTVPDVTGQQENDAISSLTSVGLTVRTYRQSSDSVPQGAVINQEPVGGTEVPISTTVAILVSTGAEPVDPPEDNTVTVPDVTGQTEADATKALNDAGLVAQSGPIFSPDVPAGQVAYQFPTGGTEVLAGSAVAIAISQGPPPEDAVEVPEVEGMSSAQAIQAIQAAGLLPLGLTSATPDGTAADTVFAQIPRGGDKVVAGAPVVFLVANGETGEIDPVPLN